MEKVPSPKKKTSSKLPSEAPRTAEPASPAPEPKRVESSNEDSDEEQKEQEGIKRVDSRFQI